MKKMKSKGRKKRLAFYRIYRPPFFFLRSVIELEITLKSSLIYFVSLKRKLKIFNFVLRNYKLNWKK